MSSPSLEIGVLMVPVLFFCLFAVFRSRLDVCPFKRLEPDTVGLFTELLLLQIT